MISGSVLTPAFGAERENGSSADGVLSGLTDQYVCRLPPDSFPSLSARSRKPWIPETTPPPAAPPGTLPAAGRRAFLCVEGERIRAESHRPIARDTRAAKEQKRMPASAAGRHVFLCVEGERIRAESHRPIARDTCAARAQEWMPASAAGRHVFLYVEGERTRRKATSQSPETPGAAREQERGRERGGGGRFRNPVLATAGGQDRESVRRRMAQKLNEKKTKSAIRRRTLSLSCPNAGVSTDSESSAPALLPSLFRPKKILT